MKLECPHLVLTRLGSALRRGPESGGGPTFLSGLRKLLGGAGKSQSTFVKFNRCLRDRRAWKWWKPAGDSLVLDGSGVSVHGAAGHVALETLPVLRCGPKAKPFSIGERAADLYSGVRTATGESVAVGLLANRAHSAVFDTYAVITGTPQSGWHARPLPGLHRPLLMLGSAVSPQTAAGPAVFYLRGAYESERTDVVEFCLATGAETLVAMCFKSEFNAENIRASCDGRTVLVSNGLYERYKYDSFRSRVLRRSGQRFEVAAKDRNAAVAMDSSGSFFAGRTGRLACVYVSPDLSSNLTFVDSNGKDLEGLCDVVTESGWVIATDYADQILIGHLAGGCLVPLVDWVERQHRRLKGTVRSSGVCVSNCQLATYGNQLALLAHDSTNEHGRHPDRLMVLRAPKVPVWEHSRVTYVPYHEFTAAIWEQCS